ncbi:hypothetical protein GCK72_003594 [Caenorhabditis remanei]|uniref:Uncharacterized protein n=1 Tax=Caenorhabditis remanei TaxID=31234 RepID=A0A6A5HXJ1_CAERE|nr:hypothetical protein GCK72_003594 [Caenorhabditis remanei]KAF1771766.1 hypothetical protein GCK72_003594 [Caenorhabditis remanei]
MLSDDEAASASESAKLTLEIAFSARTQFEASSIAHFRWTLTPQSRHFNPCFMRPTMLCQIQYDLPEGVDNAVTGNPVGVVGRGGNIGGLEEDPGVVGAAPQLFLAAFEHLLWKFLLQFLHFTPCLRMPVSNSPQKSQNVGSI